MMSIAWVVMSGVDCAIYVVSGAIFVAFAVVAIVAGPAPSGREVSVAKIGAAFAVVGLLSLLLAAFRVWQVGSALRSGDACVATVTQAGVGRARIYGTPWGEPLFAGGAPIAARGAYQVIGSQDGRYYMQQTWALKLQPGDRIWVLRRKGRDVLYAPVN
jgi:hypothetical protein